jgi:hypothetical protein
LEGRIQPHHQMVLQRIASPFAVFRVLHASLFSRRSKRRWNPIKRRWSS